MENRRRFSTFQHDKQTTSYLLLILETKSVNCPDKPAHLTYRIFMNVINLLINNGWRIKQYRVISILPSR